MAFTEQYFLINNIRSTDIGISGFELVRIDSQIERQLIGNKDIIEDIIPFKDIPTFYRTSKQPIEFNLKFSLLDYEYDSNRLIEISKLFASDVYVPFQSTDNLGVQFYIISQSMRLITFGSYKGWIEIQMRTSAPYGFSLPQISTYDLSDIVVPTTITIENKSNVTNSYGEYYYYPEVWIDLKNNNTDVQFKNYSLGGEIFGFENLSENESIYVNNQKKQIESNTGLYRLSNLIDKRWFKLGYGTNQVEISGKSKIQIKCQFPVYI